MNAAKTGISGTAIFYGDHSASPTDQYGHKATCYFKDGKVTEPPRGVQFFNREAFEAALARGEKEGRNGDRWQLWNTD